MERADEPRALPAGDVLDDVAALASDVLVLMASAGERLREVTAREEALPPRPPEASRAAGTSVPSRADGPPAPALAAGEAPAPLPTVLRTRDGVLVAPGWGRRAPPPLR